MKKVFEFRTDNDYRVSLSCYEEDDEKKFVLMTRDPKGMAVAVRVEPTDAAGLASAIYDQLPESVIH